MKLSVCITTYNHAPYIAQAIDSVLMQETDFPFEVIIGEDDSTDGTRAIVKEYAERYPDKIRLFLNDRKNVIYMDGQPTGRWNLLNNLKSAQGKYIALLDGDDYWTDPHKLQKQVDFLEGHREFVLCHHDVMLINQEGHVLQNTYLSQHLCRDMASIEVQKLAPVLTPTICFRNHLFDAYPSEFLKAPNGDTFLFSILGRFGKAKYMGAEIQSAAYRVHAGGVWSSLSSWQKDYKGSQTFYWLYYYYKCTGMPELATYFWSKYHPKLYESLYQCDSLDCISQIGREYFSRKENLMHIRSLSKFVYHLLKRVLLIWMMERREAH